MLTLVHPLRTHPVATINTPSINTTLEQPYQEVENELHLEW
jgi:hypothetical protein